GHPGFYVEVGRISLQYLCVILAGPGSHFLLTGGVQCEGIRFIVLVTRPDPAFLCVEERCSLPGEPGGAVKSASFLIPACQRVCKYSTFFFLCRGLPGLP